MAVLLIAAPSAGASTRTRAATATGTCASNVSPVYSVNGSPVPTLQGNVQQGDLVSVVVPAIVGAPCTWSLTSYQTQAASFVLAGQTRFQYVEWTGVTAHTFQVRVPSCFFQVDFAHGLSIEKLQATQMYGPLLVSHNNGGDGACVLVTPVTPDCSLVAGSLVSSAFTFTNPTTASVTVAVTQTVLGPPKTTTKLAALTVLPGITTVTLPAVEDATQRFTFVGTGIRETLPYVTIDCLKPSATVQAVCNDVATGDSTATLSVVNPDGSPETVLVATNGGAQVPLLVGANSVASPTPFAFTSPAPPPVYTVTYPNETPPFSQVVSVTNFSCVVPT